MAEASSAAESAHVMARRARKVANYAEVQAPRAGDVIVDILSGAGAIAYPGLSGLSDATKGLSLVDIAEQVRERSNAPGGGKQYGAIRQTLIKLLGSGRARRRLVTCATPINGRDTESALRLLIVSSLQIDPDPQAPWSLETFEFPPIAPDSVPLTDGVSAPEMSVGSALVPASSWAHQAFRGEALVGRTVEVWWDDRGGLRRPAAEEWTRAHDLPRRQPILRRRGVPTAESQSQAASRGA